MYLVPSESEQQLVAWLLVIRSPLGTSPPHYPTSPAGKMFVSAGEKQLALVAHVPAELAKQSGVRVREWVGEALKHIKGGQVRCST